MEPSDLFTNEEEITNNNITIVLRTVPGGVFLAWGLAWQLHLWKTSQEAKRLANPQEESLVGLRTWHPISEVSVRLLCPGDRVPVQLILEMQLRAT